ncbi:MAG: V-type ATP synthase subunit E [Chitinivibrionales bacterium]|nr:V-type ATP synthase subunit E [Chitinivibrionales bacterium]
MNQKISELTDKIYKEGVEKGEEEAKKIIADAKEKADKIISDAKQEAAKIVVDAENQAQELRRNTESELKLSGQQALSSIKQQILDVLSDNVVDKPISETLSSPQTVKEFLKIIVQNWKVAEQEAPQMELLLPESKREEMEKAFKGGLIDTMKKGMKIDFSRHIKGGFQIGPSGNTFKISMTDEDFAEFFKEYLRPRTKQYLFGE